MKIFTSCQRAVEKRVDRYISQLERDEEKENLEHMALCGSLLKENSEEIAIYLKYKQQKDAAEIDLSSFSGTSDNT